MPDFERLQNSWHLAHGSAFPQGATRQRIAMAKEEVLALRRSFSCKARQFANFKYNLFCILKQGGRI
jgi:hypothetical protein